jgi:hypothetical protein
MKMDNNYVDRKTERRTKYNRKVKGKVTKDNKNFKNIRLEELRKQDADKELLDGSVPTIHTQE